MTLGGEATFGWIPTAETRQKISDANKGRPASNKGKPSPWTSERNRRSKGGKVPNRMIEVVLIDPQGNEHRVKGLVDFCKENSLNKGEMSSVINGKVKHHKGWTGYKLEA